jgi:tetratricopeptide (TPR) repeat protein
LAILGQVSLDLGDSDTAARAYRRLLELDPDSLEARRGVALTAEAQGQEGDALEHWRRVTERTKPGETLWYEAVLHAARMEERLGQPARACAALREAKTSAGLPAVGELVSAFAELERRVCR